MDAVVFLVVVVVDLGGCFVGIVIIIVIVFLVLPMEPVTSSVLVEVSVVCELSLLSAVVLVSLLLESLPFSDELLSGSELSCCEDVLSLLDGSSFSGVAYAVVVVPSCFELSVLLLSVLPQAQRKTDEAIDSINNLRILRASFKSFPLSPFDNLHHIVVKSIAYFLI